MFHRSWWLAESTRVRDQSVNPLMGHVSRSISNLSPPTHAEQARLLLVPVQERRAAPLRRKVSRKSRERVALGVACLRTAASANRENASCGSPTGRPSSRANRRVLAVFWGDR